ncbi:lipoma-preferred partner homolog isoform X2 [Apostichopus japonicus]|uniref:lipoma-preferred partner homolog isoform X2 n=1 Tax=Stichopus japonicus TaxID=307972 RepID=UPI003AB1ED6B
MASTMNRLEQELDNLERERQHLGQPTPQIQTQRVTSTSVRYTPGPRRYAPVSAPKPWTGGNLPPSGSNKGPPPPTLPKPKKQPGGGGGMNGSRGPPPPPPPKTSSRHEELRRGLPTYTPVGYSDDPPPPPPPNNGFSSYSEPLPPPPPELSGGSSYQDQPLPPPPPPTASMQSYNEPHPASYRQHPAPAVAQNQAPANLKSSDWSYHVPKPTDQPISSPAASGTEAEVDALTNLLMQNMTSGGEEGEFFGMCNKCGLKVVGENSGCTAMDKVYHIECFTCQTCSQKLRGQPFYALEGGAFCENCYINSLEKCSTCSKPITDRILRATGKPYHPECFTCVVCGKSLDGVPFTVDATNQIHCIEDFHKKFAPRCSVCLQPIMPSPGEEETVRIVALDRSFHVGCYKCEDCGTRLSSEADGEGCFPLDDHILCRNCNSKRVNAIPM